MGRRRIGDMYLSTRKQNIFFNKNDIPKKKQDPSFSNSPIDMCINRQYSVGLTNWVDVWTAIFLLVAMMKFLNLHCRDSRASWHSSTLPFFFLILFACAGIEKVKNGKYHSSLILWQIGIIFAVGFSRKTWKGAIKTSKS